jgi:hypothetical protein
MTSARARPRLFFVVLAAIVAQAPATGTRLHAQTLANPNPQTRAPATTMPENKELKSCPAYGPGFVQVPGTNTCIKIRGSVQVQGASSVR